MGDDKQDGMIADQPNDTVPSAERQVELEARYQANITAGREPYSGVDIQTRNEFVWVLHKRDWHVVSGDNKECARLEGVLLPSIDLSGIALDGADFSRAVMNTTNLAEASLFGARFSASTLFCVNLSNTMLDGANLSEAYFTDINLANAQLHRASLRGTQLFEADLSGARLMGADLSGANLVSARLDSADLTGANLPGVMLDGASLIGATLGLVNLSGASLCGAQMSGAKLPGANLAGANLYNAHLERAILRDSLMDVRTRLEAVTLDKETRVADVIWDGVPLTRIAWENLPTLGDEAEARRDIGRDGKAKDNTGRLDDYATASRAYRQLAVALRSQGMNDDADRYAYRAQLMQRSVDRLRRQWVRWLFSGLLDALAGYGYKPERSLYAYLTAILGFAITYFILGQTVGPHLSPLGSVVFSMTAFHGRGFFPGGIALDDPITVLAALEAFAGLVIEVSFIATFTQRFFAR